MKLDKDAKINGIDGKFPDGLLITEVTRDDANSVLFSVIWHEMCRLQYDDQTLGEKSVSLDFVLKAYTELAKNT